MNQNRPTFILRLNSQMLNSPSFLYFTPWNQPVICLWTSAGILRRTYPSLNPVLYAPSRFCSGREYFAPHSLFVTNPSPPHTHSKIPSPLSTGHRILDESSDFLSLKLLNSSQSTCKIIKKLGHWEKFACISRKLKVKWSWLYDCKLGKLYDAVYPHSRFPIGYHFYETIMENTYRSVCNARCSEKLWQNKRKL